MLKKKHFGQVLAYAHVTEFQKRGLSHEHFLLIMDKKDKLSSPDDYDKYISAEILDERKYPVLHSLVCKHDARAMWSFESTLSLYDRWIL